jgi:lipopolysaccharide exporter
MGAKPRETEPEKPSMRRKVRRGLAWSTASNILLRLTNLAVGIIMARLIAPEAFGVFAVALTTWSILGSIAEFGLGADLVRRDDYLRHLPTVATLGAVLSAVLAASMFFGASAIASGFGSPEATGTVQLMSIPLLLIGLSVVPAALLQRSMRQGTLFAIDASALAISTTLMVILAIAGLGPLALAFGRIAGQTVTVILQYAAAHRWPVFGWDKTVAREAIVFGMPLAIANVVAWSTISVDNFIVARSLGPAELGLYALAFNIASWPMSVAGQSVRVIALPALSRLPSALERAEAMIKVSGPIWAISAPMALGLMFLAPQLVSIAYGDQWAGAVAAVVPLAAFGAFRVVFDLAATYLIACGMTGRVLAVQVIWLIVLIPALVAGVQAYGLAGAGWAHVAVAVLVVFPAYIAAMRKAEVSPLRFVGAWLIPTLAAVPLAAALWFVTISVPLKWAALLAGAAAGIVFYVLPLFKWWRGKLRSLEAETDPNSLTRPAPDAPPGTTAEPSNAG